MLTLIDSWSHQSGTRPNVAERLRRPVPFSVVGRVGAVGVTRFALMGSRPFVERLEIRLAKRGGISSCVEEGIGGFGQAHESAG